MSDTTVIVRFQGRNLGQCIRVAGEELRQKALALGCDLTAFTASGPNREHNCRLVTLTRRYAVYDII